ncbi:MAG: rod shape-determining protein MreC [Gemmatimonadota bacterium]
MGYPSVRRPESRRRDLALTTLLLFGAWLLARMSPALQVELTQQLRATVLAPFLSIHANLAERRGLARRVEELEAERDSLSRRLLELSGAVDENERLRVLLSLRDRRPGEFLVTELVPGRPIVGSSHTFLLRAGAREGVEPPVGVFTTGGLVGVARSTGAGFSIGDFWTHPEFAVSVRTETGGATGIVRSRRRESGGSVMLLEGAPYQADIVAGTRLVTAGVGGIYPPGIPVGTVRELAAQSESGWEKSYLVEPAVRPEEVSVVLVWRREPVGP